jgi:hypothetical protein
MEEWQMARATAAISPQFSKAPRFVKTPHASRPLQRNELSRAAGFERASTLPHGV